MPRGASIRCRTTGSTFRSLSSAAAHFGVHRLALHRAIEAGKPLKVGGRNLYFERVGEHRRRIRTPNGQEWPSAAAFIRDVEASPAEAARFRRLLQELGDHSGPLPRHVVEAAFWDRRGGLDWWGRMEGLLA